LTPVAQAPRAQGGRRAATSAAERRGSLCRQQLQGQDLGHPARYNARGLLASPLLLQSSWRRRANPWDLKNFPYVLPAATGATISSACRFAGPALHRARWHGRFTTWVGGRSVHLYDPGMGSMAAEIVARMRSHMDEIVADLRCVAFAVDDQTLSVTEGTHVLQTVIRSQPIRRGSDWCDWQARQGHSAGARRRAHRRPAQCQERLPSRRLDRRPAPQRCRSTLGRRGGCGQSRATRSISASGCLE
jgi:hypothetical protein